MATAAGKASVSETNSNMSGSAKSGVKVQMLPGPAKGRTGQKNASLGKTFRGARGR